MVAAVRRLPDQPSHRSGPAPRSNSPRPTPQTAMPAPHPGQPPGAAPYPPPGTASGQAAGPAPRNGQAATAAGTSVPPPNPAAVRLQPRPAVPRHHRRDVRRMPRPSDRRRRRRRCRRRARAPCRAPASLIRRCNRRRTTAPRRSTPGRSHRAARARRCSPRTCRCRHGAPRRVRNPIVIAGNALLTVDLPGDPGRRHRLRDRQAAFRSAGAARRGQGRQHSARRHPRHRRYPGARGRDRSAQPVHRRRADIQGAERTEIRRVQIHQERQPARRGRHHHRRQGDTARLHHSRGPDLGPDRATAGRKRDAVRQHPRRAARGHSAAGDLSVHLRHHARADDPAHAAGPAARVAGDLGAPQPRICRSRRRSNW